MLEKFLLLYWIKLFQIKLTKFDEKRIFFPKPDYIINSIWNTWRDSAKTLSKNQARGIQIHLPNSARNERSQNLLTFGFSARPFGVFRTSSSARVPGEWCTSSPIRNVRIQPFARVEKKNAAKSGPRELRVNILIPFFGVTSFRKPKLHFPPIIYVPEHFPFFSAK